MRFLEHRMFHLGPIRLLVMKPMAAGYGPILFALLLSLHISKSIGAHVFFLPPRRPLNRAVFHITSDAVRVVPQRLWSRVLIGTLWRLAYLVRAPIRTIRSLRPSLLQSSLEAAKAFTKDPRFPKPLRSSFKETVGEIWGDDVWWYFDDPSDGTPEPSTLLEAFPLDYRRAYATESIPVSLPPDRLREAADLARRLNLTENSKIVTLHVRESGYKLALDLPERPKDAARNAEIETYYEAIDLLVNKGYTVVRVGDATMRPMERPGVVDLATSPLRTEFLELWCFMRSEFFIGCDSGPYYAALLTNTPCLAVNITNPLGSYPLRLHDLYILKRSLDLVTGETLTLPEMLTEEYIFQPRKFARYRFIDNTSDEITQAVSEMVDTVRNGPSETAEQRKYRKLVTRLNTSERVRQSVLVDKGISDGLYLGDGRIAHSFAMRYIAERTVPSPSLVATA